MTGRCGICGSARSPWPTTKVSSALFARGDDDVDHLGAGPLVRFPLLGICQVSVLEGAGFEVVPTFRTPHVTIGSLATSPTDSHHSEAPFTNSVATHTTGRVPRR